MQYFKDAFSRFSERWTAIFPFGLGMVLLYGGLLVGVAATLGTTTLLGAAATDPASAAGALASATATMLIGSILVWLLGLYFTYGLLKVLRRTDESVWNLWTNNVSDAFRFLGLSVLIGVAFTAAYLVALIPTFISSALVTVTTIIWFVAAISLAAKFVTAPVHLVEGAGVVESFRASWNETNGVVWSIIGNYIVLGLVLGVIFAVIGGTTALLIVPLALGGGIAGTIIGGVFALLVGWGTLGFSSVLQGSFAVAVFEERQAAKQDVERVE